MVTRVTAMIPLERVGVLIGREGEVKNEIENVFHVDLKIDSETGMVEVSPKPGNEDASTLLRARDVVVAIGRGFSPRKALTLSDDEIILDIIDLRTLLGKNERDIARIKGRVIGENGKIRRLIEEMTETSVSIYGHTIAILGVYEAISSAREAIEMLIKGKQHSSLYGFLRKVRDEAKRRRTLELWEKSSI
jgi:ribosomal RNA assembly protein